MSVDAERIKRLVEFKKKLEDKIEALSSDLKDSQAMLETIDSILLEKGFRHLQVTEGSTKTGVLLATERGGEGESEPSSPQSHVELQNVTPLQTMAGELLANLHVTEDQLRVVLAEDKDFDVNTPPFTHFLLERVLLKMQERDNELARAGQLSSDKIFRYSIVREGDIIREIVIKNTDPERLKELKSSIRWTLEKMYEKMKSQN
ncbi:MAG: hypothetical protein ABSG57_07390 [Candidatus Bathyarchaeia archaeon]